MNNVYHVYPVNKDHIVDNNETGEHCWCKPEIEIVYDDLTGREIGWLVIHREVH